MVMRKPHKSMSQNISGVVGVSNYILNRHLETGYFNGVPNKQVIYNTRTAQELGLNAKTKEPDGFRPLRFGFIGALNPVKGIELLLQTYIGHDFPGSELWVAGVGEAGYVEKLLNIADGYSVHFLGRVKPIEFYPLVDIVIVPSLWNEPLGTVIMEAMIFGKPVIATDSGGSSEMIVDGENGLLFSPDRPTELLTAMRNLCANQEMRARLSEGASRGGVRFMNRVRFLDEHITIYMAAEENVSD
jgi:glycosyltransferase involved in cell wall biosynthesis